jgi:hypothetical protein
MVSIKEHIDKINQVKAQITNSKGNQKYQLIKHLHRLQKELKIANYYINGGDKNAMW